MNIKIIPTRLEQLKQFSISSFIATVLRFLLRILKNVVITRYLGPSYRGLFALLTTTPRMLVNFGDLGFGLGIVYKTTQNKTHKQEIIHQILLFTFMITPIIFLGGLCFILFKKNLSSEFNFWSPYTWMMFGSIPFLMFNIQSSNYFLALKKIHFINGLQIIFAALPTLLLVAISLIGGQPLQIAMIAWFISIIVISVISFIKLQVSIQFHFFNFKKIFNTLSYGLRSYISLFSTEMVRYIDLLFIAYFLDRQLLGYYAICVSIVEILLAIPDSVCIPFIPLRLESTQKDSKDFSPMIIRHIFFMMLIFSIIVIILGKAIIWILFGKEFLPAYFPMIVLILGIPFLSIYNFIKIEFFSHNLPGTVSFVSALILILNIILNYFLIPLLGIIGASLSSAICYSFLSFTLIIILKIKFQYTIKELLIISPAEILALWNHLKKWVLLSKFNTQGK